MFLAALSGGTYYLARRLTAWRHPADGPKAGPLGATTPQTCAHSVPVVDRTLIRRTTCSSACAMRSRQPQVSDLTRGFIVLRACRDSNPKPSDP